MTKNHWLPLTRSPAGGYRSGGRDGAAGAIIIRNVDELTSASRRTDLGQVGTKVEEIASYFKFFCDFRSGKDGLKL